MTMEAVARRGILVSALNSEMGIRGESLVETNGPATRILPYRNERYGLQAADFDAAGLVLWHLSADRDESGRYAYTPAQVARWEVTPDGQPLSGGGWVPVMPLPPDVMDASTIHQKVDQLRKLVQGDVFLSVDFESLTQWLSPAITCGADGLLVRFESFTGDPIWMLRQMRHIVEQIESVPDPARRPRLWMTPPVTTMPDPFDADDAAKMVAMGVSGIAIDGWMTEIVAALAEIPPRSPYANAPIDAIARDIESLLVAMLDPRQERLIALCENLNLGAVDARLAAMLNVPYLGLDPNEGGQPSESDPRA